MSIYVALLVSVNVHAVDVSEFCQVSPRCTISKAIF